MTTTYFDRIPWNLLEGQSITPSRAPCASHKEKKMTVRVTLNAARVAKRAMLSFYGMNEDDSWAPRLLPGTHEDLSEDAWIISWEEGYDYEWVYDEKLLDTMRTVLRLYADSKKMQVIYRLEPVNHFSVAIYAEAIK